MSVKKFVVISVVVVLLAALAIGWQLGSAYLAYVEFHDDIKDIAAQGNVKTGLSDPLSGDQLRAQVMNKAQKYGIEVRPEQIEIERSTAPVAAGEVAKIQIKVEYDAEINLAGYPVTLHFSPASDAF